MGTLEGNLGGAIRAERAVDPLSVAQSTIMESIETQQQAVAFLKSLRIGLDEETVWSVLEAFVDGHSAYWVSGRQDQTEGYCSPKTARKLRDLHRGGDLEDYIRYKRSSSRRLVTSEDAKLLNSLVTLMWVPEWREAPPELHDGFNEAVIHDRRLFCQVDNNEVIRCWFTDRQDGWLQQLLRAVDRDGSGRLIDDYGILQTDASKYVQEAGRRHFAVAERLGYLDPDEVESARWTTGRDSPNPEWDFAIYLLDEPRRLRGRIAEFVAEVELEVHAGHAAQ